MGRLIDADAFKQYISEGYEEYKDDFKTEKYRNIAEEVTKGFIMDIDEQPTAYDVDKVIDELEDKRDYYKREKNEAEESIEYLSEHVYEEFRNKEFAMNIAIDIAKRGGCGK